MKRAIGFALLFVCSSILCFGQEKGVDSQTKSIRDAGTNREPANNGTKQDTGSGNGIDFGKERAPKAIILPNPYRLTARQNVILKSVEDLMRERKMIPDTSASRPVDGVIVSQPYTFIKGSVVAESEISRYADLLPSNESRGWTRGRYTLTVEVQPIDGASANISVNAKIEARSEGATGAEWTTLKSNGTVEQEFLNALIGAITGNSPAGTPAENP